MFLYFYIFTLLYLRAKKKKVDLLNSLKYASKLHDGGQKMRFVLTCRNRLRLNLRPCCLRDSVSVIFNANANMTMSNLQLKP